jgi:acetate kinase
MRELLAAAGDARAQLALDVLAWRLRAAFGAMIANLGGADLVVFTGGIGEHVASVRAAGLAGGLGLGLALDDDRNAAVTEGSIGSAASPVRVAVVRAREGWQLARAAVLDGFRDS